MRPEGYLAKHEVGGYYLSVRPSVVARLWLSEIEMKDPCVSGVNLRERLKLGGMLDDIIRLV